MTAISRHAEQARKHHLAELERLLSGPIAERGLRERIRTEYIMLKDLEDTNVQYSA